MEPTLSQALHLLNGDTVNNKIQSGGIIDKMLAEKIEPLAIIERLYIATLARQTHDAGSGYVQADRGVRGRPQEEPSTITCSGRAAQQPRVYF